MTTTVQPPIWTDQEPYQIALDALQRFQWSVFPLDEDKRPPMIGSTHADGQPKRLGWKHLQARRAAPKEVAYWQKTYMPSAWAVITGALSNIVLLDFDGEAGQQTRTRLGLLHPHVQTGSGGHHVYFRHPGWPVSSLNCKSSSALGERWPGLDIRADGGYAAFCGQNTHGPYRWLRDPELDDLSALPEALRRYLGLWEAPEMAGGVVNVGVTEGALNLAHTQTEAEALLGWALRLVREEGRGRNDTGFLLACQLRDNGYAPAATRDVLREYVERVPKENTKGQSEPYTLEEAFASVSSAFQRAARDAWTVTAPASSGKGDNGAGASSASPGKGGNGGGASSGKGGNGFGASSVPETSEEPESLPVIFVNREHLLEIVDQAVEAIVRKEGESPSLFIQSARLVRIGRNEFQRPLLVQMGMTEVKEVLIHCARFYRLRKIAGREGEYERSPVSPPNELAEQILARQSQAPFLPFPGLAAIVEVPVIRPDGSILDRPGYDPATQLYYAPSKGMEACKVALKPSVKEREEALSLLLSTIGEFPYVSDADKANALALLLTPILRPALKRHVPLALIDAPKQGTGKGLLSDVVSLIATGNCAAILTLSENEEELQKLITSLLIEGTTIITIDNITGRLQSRHLDAALTSDMWRGRILGASKMALVPQCATWIATGNNIKVGGDLVRRCYRIRLDAKVSRPFMRKDFTHSDLVEWVSEQRAELVGALLTLARAWYAAGKPQYPHLSALGTFSGWVKIVGGILEYAGVHGFLSNLERLYDDADEDGSQWEAFFTVWRQIIGEGWVPLATVVAAITAANDEENGAGSCEENGKNTLYETLPAPLQMALKEKPRSFSIRLGKALERLVDTCFGSENFRLEKKRDSHSRNNLWRIFAAGAVSVSTPARVEKKNDTNVSITENIYRESGNNPQHQQQTREAQNGSNGLVGGASAISSSMNHPQNSEKPIQLPTTTQEMEEFTI